MNYLKDRSKITGSFLKLAVGVLALLLILACGGSAAEPSPSPKAPPGMFYIQPTTEPPIVGDQPPSIELNMLEPILPPTVEPPTVQPPTVQPPTVQPPTVQPPTVQPPTVQPPTVQPPTVQPPRVEPPRVNVPGPPTGLSARADGETEIDLSWSRPSSDGGSRVIGYRIEVSKDGAGRSVLESDTSRTSYTHRGLSSGSTHYYRVSATNSAGTGPPSNTAHATTSAPCEGMTLEQATKGRHTEIVQCLVDKGADVNAKASDGNPLLHLSIRGNFIEIVRILVDAGANASAKDVEGNPLLHRAIKGKLPKL